MVSRRPGYTLCVMDPLDPMLELVRSHVPGLRLVHKHEVRWMRLFGWVVRPLIPDFATRYTTVIGRVVYLPAPPEELPRRELAATLAHELVHQLDQRRWGLLFYASYAWCLPMGRTFRAYWERRAYAVDLMIVHEQGGPDAVERTAELLADLFSGPGYFWMWAGKESARQFLRPTVESVLDGTLSQRAPYDAILAAWRQPTASSHAEVPHG